MSNYMKMSNFRIKKANNKNNIMRARNQSVKRGRLLGYYHQQLMNYIYGLAHPELAINSPNIPKAPSYVSIPTSNITFREAFDINPDVNGEFILFWTPNFLCSQPQIEKRSSYAFKNYSRNWLGGYNDEHKEFGYYPVAAYAPPASFVKYRLVSAGCKITYKGPVIQRAGIISHCLTYKAFPMPFFTEDYRDWIGQSAYDGATDPTVWNNTLQNLDVTVIQNGMWSSIQNIQKNKTVFVCAVPTDPSDFIFEDDAYFYQAATATQDVEIQNIHVADVPQGGSEYDIKMGIQLPQDGTPMSYIFKGTDLTNDAKLYVEQFYNFEVIPTEESAPILRPRTNDLNSDQLEKAKNTITKVLELKKGNSSSISKKLIDSFVEDPLYYIQPQNVYPNDPNFISNQVKNAKTSFKNQVKNFGKDLLKESKNVLKDVSNVLFTKDNAYKLGETIANMVVNKMSK